MSEGKIIETFTKSQSSLVLQNSDLSLMSISDMVNTGAIDVMPKYQRRERWKPETNSELIESFLLNIPVPPIYLSEDEYGVYSVIDGKQRVTAINKFLNNEFKLFRLERFKELEGFYFKDLPSPISNALKIRPYLRVVTLLRQSDPELKHEVFLRLNKAGIALNSQEIRNVAFRGTYNEMLLKLSEIDFFRKQIGADNNSTVYKEMGDIQFVLRFFTLRSMYLNFPGNMDKAMDTYMKDFHASTDKTINEHIKVFTRSLNFCQTVFGDSAFKKPNGNAKTIQGFFDIQMVPASLVSHAELQNAVDNKDELIRRINAELENNENFLESVTQFTSNAKNVEYRISRVIEIIKDI